LSMSYELAKSTTIKDCIGNQRVVHEVCAHVVLPPAAKQRVGKRRDF